MHATAIRFSSESRASKNTDSDTVMFVASADSTESQRVKKQRTSSLFGHYRQMTQVQDGTQQRERVLSDYLEAINSTTFCGDDDVLLSPQYSSLAPLFSRVFCVPASSAPVERIFSQSGLIMRPHRAKMSDTLLETLVFLKCNSNL